MTKRLKLGQKSEIILKKKADVINAELKHGNSFNAQAKSKSCNFFNIVSNILKDCGVNHATAENFNPAGPGTNTAAISITNYALYIHFSTRFCKWEKAWTEPDQCFFIKYLVYDYGEHTL